MTPIEPFEDGDRDANGRFRPGNKGGPGSPVARQARQMRERLSEALLKICSPDRLLAAVDACMKRAEAGDVQALKFLSERIGGLPVSSDLHDRLEALEVKFYPIELDGGKTASMDDGDNE